jgi:hypothetical protein
MAAEKLTEQDIAWMRRTADEYDSLLKRWREARAYSQETANLHATFKARAGEIGQYVENGLFRRVLATLDAHGVKACGAVKLGAKNIPGSIPADELDAKVEAWHNGAGEGKPLHEFLGMTWEQYAEWVSNPAGAALRPAAHPVAWANEDGLERVEKARTGYVESPLLTVNATRTDLFTVPLYRHPPAGVNLPDGAKRDA